MTTEGKPWLALETKVQRHLWVDVVVVVAVGGGDGGGGGGVGVGVVLYAPCTSTVFEPLVVSGHTLGKIAFYDARFTCCGKRRWCTRAQQASFREVCQGFFA